MLERELLEDAIGGAAAICSMASFAPPLFKILRDRDASAVSLKMFVITAVGFILWSTYGGLSKAWPLVVSSLVCLGLSVAILTARLRLSGRDGRHADR